MHTHKHCGTWNLFSFTTNWSPMDVSKISAGNRFSLSHRRTESFSTLWPWVCVCVFLLCPCLFLCCELIFDRKIHRSLAFRPPLLRCRNCRKGGHRRWRRWNNVTLAVHWLSQPNTINLYSVEDVCDLGSYVIEMNICSPAKNTSHVYSHDSGESSFFSRVLTWRSPSIGMVFRVSTIHLFSIESVASMK